MIFGKKCVNFGEFSAIHVSKLREIGFCSAETGLGKGKKIKKLCILHKLKLEISLKFYIKNFDIVLTKKEK